MHSLFVAHKSFQWCPRGLLCLPHNSRTRVMLCGSQHHCFAVRCAMPLKQPQSMDSSTSFLDQHKRPKRKRRIWKSFHSSQSKAFSTQGLHSLLDNRTACWWQTEPDAKAGGVSTCALTYLSSIQARKRHYPSSRTLSNLTKILMEVQSRISWGGMTGE